MEIRYNRQRVTMAITNASRKSIYSFIKTYLTQYDFTKKIPSYQQGEGEPYEIKNIFATIAKGWVYIPIAFKEEFIRHLETRGFETNVIEEKDYLPKKITLTLTKDYKKSGNPLTLRDYQVPTVNSVLDNKNDPMRNYGLQPGDGKTLCSLVTAKELGVRTVVIVRASLLDQWANEVMGSFDDLTEDDVAVIKGGDSLRELLFQIKNKEVKAKVICISNKTYQLYMTNFTSKGDEGYIIPPTHFFSSLRVGLLIIDEFHLDFHLWMTLLNLSDINRVLTLTATLLTEDRFLKGFYMKIVPRNVRYDPMINDPYIKYISMNYSFDDYNFRNIQYKQKFRKTYSHVMLEQSILMNKKVSNGFDKMILKIYDGLHHKRSKEGEKSLLFTSTVEFAEHMTTLFKKTYPDLKVLTYTAGVKMSEIDSHDHIIATPGKASVGLDVAGLVSVFNTVAISAPAPNIQIVGRLRMPKKKESEKVFVQLNCKNIPIHGKYTMKRFPYLKDRTKSMSTLKYQTPL